MPDPFTAAWEEAVASNPKNIVQIETLELINPAFIDDVEGVTSIRCCNDLVDHNLRHESTAPMFPGQYKLYKALPFDITFPGFEEGKGPEATVRVDNIGWEVGQYLDEAEGLFQPITCLYRVYLSNAKGVVAFGPFKFIMRDVLEKGAAIEGKVTMANVQNLRFLRKTYSKKEYPSLQALS